VDKDKQTFERIGAEGTANMVAASRTANVSASSSVDDRRVHVAHRRDTTRPSSIPQGTYYERSSSTPSDRRRPDRLGLDAVFLHPSAVYGPAPSDSPGVNELIVKLWNKAPGLLPGRFPKPSRPMSAGSCSRPSGEAGARYILSERTTALDLARDPPGCSSSIASRRVCRCGCARSCRRPAEWIAGLPAKPPLIPKGQLKFLQIDSFRLQKRAAIGSACSSRRSRRGSRGRSSGCA
jgi:hypothetical protein